VRYWLLLGLLSIGAAAQELTREAILAKAAVTEVWQPEPPVVTPGLDGKPPMDAIVLFDGSNQDAWESVKGGPASWQVTPDALTVVAGQGDIRTREHFTDVQLHIEWATPALVKGEGQGRGNSGVFFMEQYEVQVLDSYDNRTYSNGQAASVYKQHIPLVNASRAPGEWQTYDIIFNAPRFSEQSGRVAQPASVTVLHNGVVVQNHVTVQGPTEFIGKPQYQVHGPGPIKLQDHGNPVRYRNIWIRRL
jgi:hypothetical protein